MKLHFLPLAHDNMDLVLLHNQGFHRILQFFKICQCLSLHFVIKCVLNNRIRGKLCVQYKMNPFWTFIIVYYCNLWYPVISVRKWNVCYFFLIFCYKMKCLGILRIYLPLFFSYVDYSCRMSRLKYQGTIWPTLYSWVPINRTVHIKRTGGKNIRKN